MPENSPSVACRDLRAPVQHIRGVGPQVARLLTRLGVITVRDLLFTSPSVMRTGARQEGSPDLSTGEYHAVTGEVTRCDIIAPGRRNRRLKMVSVTLTDGTGTVMAKWFNQTYLKKTFQPGRRIMISGVVKKDFGAPVSK
ncbi:MAG: OB-fold nucleic acid binding domain-containing protein [Desulfosudis oleivorans]|nr:OB-fold nucleic acid binding domain-containing protein [Desulfosudis oleivorans]